MYKLAPILFGSWAYALSAAGIHVVNGPRQWSSKRIVASIRRLGQRREALRYSSIYRCRRSLYEAAIKCFGGWRQALIAADFDPDAVRAVQRWDKNAVIEAILLRVVKNLPLGPTKVRPSGLRAAGAAIFGSWPDALRAAGLSPESFLGLQETAKSWPSEVAQKSGIREWTHQTVAAAIHQRLQQHKAVNDKSVRRDDSRLYSAAKKRFRNWSHALSFAGLDPEKIRLDGKRATKPGPSPAENGDKDIDAKSSRPEADNSMNLTDRSAVAGTGHADVGKAASETVDWRRRAHRRKRWTREAIIVAIQARVARGLPLKKWMVQPHHLGQVASIEFGSWDEALRAAGVDINQPRIEAGQGVHASTSQALRCDVADSAWAKIGPPWTREVIMEVIRRRADARLPLNEAIIRVECGGMYGAAKAKFGSWAGALTAFGLNPDDIRKGPKRSEYPAHVD
jgi:hypothetical protein